MACACSRLVRPDVTDPDARGLQARLVGVGLAGPFVLVGGCLATLSPIVSGWTMLAASCALFGTLWLLGMSVAATGRTFVAGAAMLGVAALTVGVLVATAGGLASPIALLAVALAVTPYQVFGRGGWAVAGLAAGLCALAAGATAAALGAGAGATPIWAHWLPALAWAVMAAVAHDQASRPATEPLKETDAAVEAMTQGVLVGMSRNGEILRASQRVAEVLAIGPEFLIGTPLLDRVHLTDRVGYLSALADLRHAPGHRRLEFRLRLPPSAQDGDGDRFYPFVADMLRREGQDAVSVLLRPNDEVERLRADLASARERADSTDATKNRFLAAVSHELRTPLNAIIGFSDMLVHEMFGPFADPRQKDYAGLIRQSGEHLLSVVNAILDVSKIEAGTYTIQCENFQFSDAARMSLTMLQLQAAEKSIEIENAVTEATGQLVADRRAVQQILINLISNAVKFTPDNGTISIGARRSGDHFRFWVSDSGIGMSEADLARVGQPFMQIQNDYTRNFVGTGLGLSLVKGLVRLHQGGMSIESAPGLGTTVTITLPAAGPSGASNVSALDAASTSQITEAPNGPFRKTA